MIKTTQTTIEHIELVCSRSYDQVTASLQDRLGSFPDPAKFRSQLPAGASWAQIEKTIEGMLGSSGLSIFHKVEHGDLLSLLAGRPRRVSQYAIGNPLLAIRMIQYEPGAALYAPLRAGRVRGRRRQMRCRLRSIYLTAGAVSTSGDCLGGEAGRAESGRPRRRGNVLGAANPCGMNGSH